MGWTLDRRARTADELMQCASEVAGMLAPGDVVALRGPLGAGKTTFVRGIVHALHGSDQVSSPTFMFWHRYDGAPQVNHLDLYRIEDRSELLELGLEEALGPDVITLIEWPERAPALFPQRYLDIAITGCGDEPRDVHAHVIVT